MASRTARSAEPRQRAASEVKAHWRDIVAEANAHGEVLVTNHRRPEVVVLSVERYEKLTSEAAANDPLTRLRADFGHELAVLRGTGASTKLRNAFASTPAQLAKAANASASRRRR